MEKNATRSCPSTRPQKKVKQQPQPCRVAVTELRELLITSFHLFPCGPAMVGQIVAAVATGGGSDIPRGSLPMETYIIAVRREARTSAPADWLDSIRDIPGLSISGSSNSSRVQVEASPDAIEDVRQRLGTADLESAAPQGRQRVSR